LWEARLEHFGAALEKRRSSRKQPNQEQDQ
jgi:hypothetical protein